MRKSEKDSIFSKSSQIPILSSWIPNIHIIMCQFQNPLWYIFFLSLHVPPHSAILRNTPHYSTILCKTLQYSAILCHTLSPRFATCVLDPYNSTHTIITVTVKKCDQLAPRFATCVLDLYNSTHTIIRLTVKKCDQNCESCQTQVTWKVKFICQFLPVPSRPVLFTQSVIYVGIELLWQLKRPLDQCQILQDIEELLKSKT